MTKNEIKQKIKKLKTLLWGYNIQDVIKNPSNIIVIERVLEFGDFTHFKILKEIIGDAPIIEYIKKYGKKRLSKKSYNFWMLYYELHKTS